MSAAVTFASFIAGVVMGTGSTITIKLAYGLNSTDSQGVNRRFEKPLTTTFIMFVAMSISLPIYSFMVLCHRGSCWGRFVSLCSSRRKRSPSDPHRPLPLEATLLDAERVADEEDRGENVDPHSNGPWISWRLFFLLLIPAFFDLTGTALAKVGLMHCSVSVYQLVRCSVIVFTSIAKTLMGRRLPAHMWFGVFLVTVAMVGVSASSLISSDASSSSEQDPAVGITFLLGSCLVASLQYVFEEKVMSDDGAHPLVVVGMEGFWGVVLFLSIVFPWAYILSGDDVGSLENAYDSYIMARNSTSIQLALLGFFVTVAFYNIFAVYLTHLMSSIWHAILDCFRPVSVWGTDLLIFYVITNGTFGEKWGVYSWLELAGMLLLFFGTAVFNGNIRFSCCPPKIAEGVDGSDADDRNGDDLADSDFMEVYSTPTGLVFSPPTPVTRQQKMPASSDFIRSPLVTRNAMRSAARWNRHLERMRRIRTHESNNVDNAYASANFFMSDPTAQSRIYKQQKAFSSSSSVNTRSFGRDITNN